MGGNGVERECVKIKIFAIFLAGCRADSGRGRGSGMMLLCVSPERGERERELLFGVHLVKRRERGVRLST